MDLVDLESFRPTLMRILPQVSGTRNNPLIVSLLEKLDRVFPLLFQDDHQGALLIVGTALNPVPHDEASRNLALKFVNSISSELLLEYPYVFNYEALIKASMESGCMSHLAELKKLMEKVGYKVHSLDVDWIGKAMPLALELCHDPPPDVLIELLQLGLVPYSSIPKVIDHMKNAKASQFYPIAYDTLFWLTSQTGGKDVCKKSLTYLQAEGAEWVIDKSFLTNHDTKELIKHVSSPYTACDLGTIIGALLDYLASLYECVPHTQRESASLPLMASFLSRIFPDSAITLLTKVLSHPEVTKECRNSWTTSLLKDYIPDKYTPQFARFAVEQVGAEEAFKLAPSVCIDACKVDRNIALAFADVLQQPLPLMRTFLAFENIEKHREWLQRCRREIPQSEWILAEGDDGYVPPQDPVTRTDNQSSEETDYQFIREKPAAGLPNVLDGTRYALISYFTHYTSTTTPSEISGATIEELEQFVYENAQEDIRLVIGFFFYAYKRKFKTTRIEEWTKKLQSVRTDGEMYAVALFLNSISLPLKELPDFMSDFLNKHLLYLGYCGLIKNSLNYAFQKETGMRWFFIRSVISLDPNFMAEFPLVLAEFADRQSLPTVYTQYLSHINPERTGEQLLSLFVSLVAVLFKPNKVIQHRRWPIVHRALFALPVAPILPAAVKIDSRILDVVLTTLEHQKQFPTQFFTLFLNIDVEKQFYDRVLNLIKPKSAAAGPFFTFLLPAMYFLPVIERDQDPVLNEDALNFFENRPPSFALAFYRSLLAFFAPPIRQTLISEIENILPPVFPEFGYTGLKVWDNAFEVTKIISGELCDDPVSHIKHLGRVSLAVYNALMSNPGFTDKTAATSAIVKLAVSPTATIAFAITVADTLAKYYTDVEDIVCAPEFFDNLSNPLTAVLFLSRLSKALNKPELLDRVKDNTKDAERAKFFECLQSRQKLKEALDTQYPGSP